MIVYTAFTRHAGAPAMKTPLVLIALLTLPLRWDAYLIAS